MRLSLPLCCSVPINEIQSLFVSFDLSCFILCYFSSAVRCLAARSYNVVAHKTGFHCTFEVGLIFLVFGVEGPPTEPGFTQLERTRWFQVAFRGGPWACQARLWLWDGYEVTEKVEEIFSFRACFIVLLLFLCRRLKAGLAVGLGFWLEGRATSYFFSKKYLIWGKRVLEPRPSTFCSFSSFFLFDWRYYIDQCPIYFVSFGLLNWL